MLNLLASGRGRAGKLKVSKVFYVSLDTPCSFNAELAGLAQRQKETGKGHRGLTCVVPSWSVDVGWVGWGQVWRPLGPPKVLLGQGLAS